MNTRPTLAGNDSRNGGFAHSEFFGKRFSGLIFCASPNFKNLLNGKLCSRVVLALRGLGVVMCPVTISSKRAAFPLTVLHVLFASAKEKVVRIRAGRVIAFVQAKQAVRNRTEMENPTRAVGVNLIPSFFGKYSIRSLDQLPRPASIRLDNRVPKPLPEGGIKSLFKKHCVTNLGSFVHKFNRLTDRALGSLDHFARASSFLPTITPASQLT